MDPSPNMSSPPVVREPMGVRTRSRTSVLATPNSTKDATNDVDAHPRTPPDRISDGNEDAKNTHDNSTKGLSDWENVEVTNDASRTDAQDDFRSEHDDGEKRGGNDDCGAEYAGANDDGGGDSAEMILVTEEDVDDKTDVLGVDSSASASNATNEIDVAKGSLKRVQSSGTRNHAQDDFVKNGAHVKAILASALRAVVDGMSSNSMANSCGAVAGDKKFGAESERRSVDDGDDKNQTKGQEKADYARLLDLAHEKAEECILLNRVRFHSVIILSLSEHQLLNYLFIVQTDPAEAPRVAISDINLAERKLGLPGCKRSSQDEGRPDARSTPNRRNECRQCTSRC
jgi:hypothetical protein